MKTKLFLTILIALLLVNCGQFQIFEPKVDHKSSAAIQKAQPKHIGSGQSGSYGLYDYTVYQYSVSIRATSAVVTVTNVEVYDLNRDGRLDSVFVLEHGVWKFASYLGPQYRLISNTASGSVLGDYVGLANYARRSAIADQKIAAEKRRREEEQERNREIQKNTFPYSGYYTPGN